MRIPIGIISGFILGLWNVLVFALGIVNFFIVLSSHKRSKEIANFCEIWNTQSYVYLKYTTFVSNKRPFPFAKLAKNLSDFET